MCLFGYLCELQSIIKLRVNISLNITNIDRYTTDRQTGNLNIKFLTLYIHHMVLS